MGADMKMDAASGVVRDTCAVLEFAPAHIPAVLEIERESFSDPWSENMFTELLASPAARAYVAESNGEVLGFIMFYNIAPELQILNLAVRKSARKKQIGSRLIESVLALDNISRVTLEVRGSNLPAIGLYKKFGFKADGTRKNYYERPREDAVLMSLEIPC